MNSDLDYLADSLIIEALAKDNLIVFAQEGGVINSVANGIKDYVSELYDPNRPIASVVSFIGPGLLWKLGFPWMSVLYTATDALGFDWKSFWSEVGKGIAEFVRTIKNTKDSGEEPDESGEQINDVVSAAFQSSFTGEVDKDKLIDAAKKYKFATRMSDALEIKAVAIRLQKNPDLIKNAGVLSIFKGKLAKFFIRTISWTIKTALISLGLFSGAGAAKGLFGGEAQENDPIYSLKVSPNASPDIFTVHPNDMSRVWIERGNIESIGDIIKSWIVSVYPDYFNTSEKINELETSSSFRSMVNAFTQRNRLASGLGMISVPRPYQRKADIVATVVSGYLHEKPQQSNQQPGNNITYK